METLDEKFDPEEYYELLPIHKSPIIKEAFFMGWAYYEKAHRNKQTPTHHFFMNGCLSIVAKLVEHNEQLPDIVIAYAMICAFIEDKSTHSQLRNAFGNEIFDIHEKSLSLTGHSEYPLGESIRKFQLAWLINIAERTLLDIRTGAKNELDLLDKETNENLLLVLGGQLQLPGGTTSLDYELACLTNLCCKYLSIRDAIIALVEHKNSPLSALYNNNDSDFADLQFPLPANDTFPIIQMLEEDHPAIQMAPS